jgi:hypothetical protein
LALSILAEGGAFSKDILLMLSIYHVGKEEKMAKKTQEMQSWQVLHFARKHLGRNALYVVFGKKNSRIVDYWCENPKYTGKPDKAYDPIQGVKDLLEALDDAGHTTVVRSCINYLLSGTSLDNGDDPNIKDLLPTVNDEILADYRDVASLQEAIEQGMDIETVNERKNISIEELERTFAKYLEVAK